MHIRGGLNYLSSSLNHMNKHMENLSYNLCNKQSDSFYKRMGLFTSSDFNNNYLDGHSLTNPGEMVEDPNYMSMQDKKDFFILLDTAGKQLLSKRGHFLQDKQGFLKQSISNFSLMGKNLENNKLEAIKIPQQFKKASTLMHIKGMWNVQNNTNPQLTGSLVDGEGNRVNINVEIVRDTQNLNLINVKIFENNKLLSQIPADLSKKDSINFTYNNLQNININLDINKLTGQPGEEHQLQLDSDGVENLPITDFFVENNNIFITNSANQHAAIYAMVSGEVINFEKLQELENANFKGDFNLQENNFTTLFKTKQLSNVDLDGQINEMMEAKHNFNLCTNTLQIYNSLISSLLASVHF